ncbi:MAG: hypothetical protein ACO1N9_02160 [Flavobacterium sp.]
MIKKAYILFFILTSFTATLSAQNYERYKKLKDTTIVSKYLRYEKDISVIVPIEWQRNSNSDFPLIIIFDSQNQRSHNYIINTIDYLTSNEQIPSSVIISIASSRQHRLNETQYKISDVAGLALENEQFIFDELIPIAEKRYKAGAFRMFIGHSRYGYFTTSLFINRVEDLNAVIAISPFFTQKNIELADSISKMDKRTYLSEKYYRFAIGNDFPEDYSKMEAVLKKLNPNPSLNIRAYRFKEAGHNVTPGLFVSVALYEIFEEWAAVQAKYTSVKQKEVSIITSLDNEIQSHYGSRLNFSIGNLNGKGWHFYNEKDYGSAIKAWQILLATYPNFSEGYLSIIKARKALKQDYSNTVKDFKESLSNSELYTEKQKNDLLAELDGMVK